MKKLKNLILVLMAIVMLFSEILGTASAAEQEQPSNLYEFDDLIAYLDEKVSVICGQFVLSVSEDEIACFDQEDFESILYGMDTVNGLLRTDAYDVTANGTVYETDEQLVIQGGNVDKVVVKWWGIKRYASKSSADKIVSTFNTISNSAWMVPGGTASYAAAAALFPEGLISKTSSAVSAFVSGITAVAAGYYGLIATRIDAKNGTKGVIINITWVGAFTVTSQ